MILTFLQRHHYCTTVLLFATVLGQLIDESSKDAYLHDKSPRHKRQAYPVFSAPEGKLIIDPVGQYESGPWEDWQTNAECSRTCGGGVRIETRKCGGSGCTGSRKRYVSCNTEPCESGAKEFRSTQCSEYNDKPLEGKYYKWKAFTKAPNKCELTCIPEGESFYYKWADKVVDGTKCSEMSNDICVEGYCLPLGCDGKLGSLQKEDKCGVCGGDGTTCKTMRGFFDERHMAPGYVDIITLPVGASSILIYENKPTSNYLALRNESGHYHLNGNWKIDFPQTMEIAGTLFEYERNKRGPAGAERIYAKGPIDEPVVVVLLYQADNTGIHYEYTLPLDETLPYMYKMGEWSECSVTCGRGLQTRTATCVDRLSKQPAEESLCANSSLPETNRTCNSIDCETEWFQGEWEECSHTCGDSGLQYRTVYCHQVAADGVRVTVDDAECQNLTRPEVKQSCNRFACPEWQAGPWSSCSKDCGSAFQYRAIMCRSEKVGDEGKLLPGKQCNETLKPEDKRTCNLGPCEGLRWVSSDWVLCSKCNDTTEYRNVSCEDASGRRYPEEKCKDKRPDDSRDCASVIPCVYKWQSSQWSECSSECGHGHQTRSIHCTIDENGSLRKMDESFCDEKLKPELRQNCTHEGETCSGTYYSSPWTNCTADCGGGTQTRTVVCFDYDYKVRPQMCDENEKPDEVQDCNLDKCLSCNETDFGCCPDNVTVAIGPYFEGCSNCSETEFGCCPDNYTTATGPDDQGCPVVEGSGEEPENLTEACQTSEFGCCPDGNTTATSADKSDCPEVLCDYTNEKGETIQVPCVNATLNETLATNETLCLNETECNATEIHCSKTEFGCCPDWYTPANGTDFAECPPVEIGTCNDTKHGCCPDGLTLARGPNLEGCGDPSCAGSMFGCCKDRLTIAFGTHYAGCERANQPCETSKFGCCADGLTAALGKNAEGCDEDCRLTKFGCCPDGKTVSKGSNNEGCGCAASPFGCCPDGKTAAAGPNFHGCPETCARSYYGCCPDGKTTAQGPNKEGCPCVYTQHGCCPDGETAARGPNKEGCDDCRFWKFGCCEDGRTRALDAQRLSCRSRVDFQTPPSYTRRPAAPASPNQIAACTLPKSEGQVCADYVLMWFYDANEGICRQFWFGGCSGNDNRFGSEQECRDVCVEPQGTGVCYLPKIEGPQNCGNLEPRWFYDLRRSQCQAFYYRGCNGNANNFQRYEDCMGRCESVKLPFVSENDLSEVRSGYESSITSDRDHVTDHTDYYVHSSYYYTTQQPSGDVCDYPPDAGTCQIWRESWYFDSYSRQCNVFQYGGCDGNPNRFQSRSECEQICRHKLASIPVDEFNVCNYPMDRGPCAEWTRKFYYEPALGRCAPFDYGGCQGNDNRFDSEHQCRAKCEKTAYEVHEDACSVAKDAGPCDDFVPKWFFNAADGTCGRFYYGGCHGNKNRFDSLEDCEERCASRIDPCTLPPIQGPCSGSETRWYWDSNGRRCNQFTYGGCLGNKNRFDSAQECQQRCGGSAAGGGGAETGRTPAVISASVEASRERSHEDDTHGHLRDDLCRLHRDEGPCRGYHYRYFFNYSSRACEAFIYGGCGGNDNRFEQIEQCETRCARYSRRHVQSDTRKDLIFEDKGDLDVFKSVPLSSLHTQHVTTTTSSASLMTPVLTNVPTLTSAMDNNGRDNNEDICHLAPDSGICQNMTQRWYYDHPKHECRQFNYGGCLGNLNNFETVELCREYCVDDESREDFDAPKRDDAKPSTVFGKGTMISALGGERPDIVVDEHLPPVSYPPPISPIPDLCQQPKDPGDCFEDVLRYYYDSEKQKCQSFQYTNCKGNSNKFLSLEECERACGQYRDSGVCALPADAGNCFASVMKWYWNPRKASCQTFVYGGCGGNGNRFGSKEECESLCTKETASLPTDICQLTAEPGPCDAKSERFFYNKDSLQCEKFTYGGCRGNENNFETAQACDLRCSRVKSGSDDFCNLTWDSGPCTDPITQYFYDSGTKECKLFTYGGCRGNKNRFDTKMECESRCKGPKSALLSVSNETICRLPMDQGACDAKALRFFYNPSTGKCESFNYNGCLGNDNRFFTEQECQEFCGGIGNHNGNNGNLAIVVQNPVKLTGIRETFSVTYDTFPITTAQGKTLTINLNCRVTPVQRSTGIVWYKNGQLIKFNENANFSLLRNGTLRISPATRTDSGNYSCNASDAQQDLSTSLPTKIDIIETADTDEDPQCTDDHTKANCHVVKTAGLCDHLFYGRFCCRTCRLAKLTKKAKRLKWKMI